MHSLPLRPEVLDKHAQLLAEGRVVESDVASAQMALCETQVRVKGDQLFLACPFQGMLGQPLRMDHRQGDTVQIPLESLLQGFVMTPEMFCSRRAWQKTGVPPGLGRLQRTLDLPG